MKQTQAIYKYNQIMHRLNGGIYAIHNTNNQIYFTSVHQALILWIPLF